MIASGLARPTAILLSLCLAVPAAFGQSVPQNPPPTAQPAASASSPPVAMPGQLRVIALEGNNVLNSIPLSRSVTPVVEVRDENEFPVEGATVVFTLPESGPGGTFPGNRTSLTTRTSSQGQAGAPFLMNGLPGKFEIRVTATSGIRKGEAVLTQTNSAGGYVGQVIPPKPVYKKWWFWTVIGGAAAAGITAWLVTRDSDPSSSTTVTITPGGPVFGSR